MILKTAYVRFFRSFNFDYLRSESDSVERLPWDFLGDEETFYPFVAVDLERDITTVVGANESGKSQLITAIRCLLDDLEVQPKDFCRYSSLFGVRGGLKVPEVGGRFTDLSDDEDAAVRSVIPGVQRRVEEFWFFLLATGPRVYVRAASGAFAPYSVPEQDVQRLMLPRAHVIDSRVALPQNVSLQALSRGRLEPEERDRKTWYKIHRDLLEHEEALDRLPQVTGAADTYLNHPGPVVGDDEDEQEDSDEVKSFKLAQDMLVTVADIGQDVFTELLDAGSSDDGYGEALAAHITDALASALNFPHWWSQDRDFALEVRKDGFYLILTMRDRTGQTYTFDERSSGMKYFLSYFVQHKAYTPNDEGRSEVILMDEPDAFLSTQGQQDLLQIFESYAAPSETSPGAQVLYVTHSPFLIDKNRPDRIRVLQKGAGEEGTRVIRKAAVDKYEPLRSAFGSFHAETAFIGNCNLLVEGPADQVLLAGLSSVMRMQAYPGPTLDLNGLTLVPVHGATEYRYTLHLTRARDLDRPAVVVLMDSDAEGKAARPDLEKGYKDQLLLDPTLIFSIGDLAPSAVNVDVSAVEEPEDLVPAAVARQAVLHFAAEVFSGDDVAKVVKSLKKTLAPKAGQRMYDLAMEAAAAASQDCSRPLGLGKVEFARAVCAVAPELASQERQQLFDNFSVLFAEIDERARRAMQENTEERTQQSIKRLVERFKVDHRTRTSKEAVQHLLDEVLDQLPAKGDRTDATYRLVGQIRTDYALDDAPREDVQEFKALRKTLTQLVHAELRVEEGLS